ncbi:MAG: FAD-dependent oxidoreductase [Pseudomonadota bacterium]|nr:FAD-dependent oxidoreductase [Pseudomonadota bacterium]
MIKIANCVTGISIFVIQLAFGTSHANTCAQQFRSNPPLNIPFFPLLPQHEDQKPDYEKFVVENYGYKDLKWIKIEKGDIPVVVKGQIDESKVRPLIDTSKATPDPQYPDVELTVVGGGIAGLTSAFYAARNGLIKKILILENKARLGGIAMWNEVAGTIFGEAGAYFTKPEMFARLIAKHIGLWDTLENYEIPEHIDSYFWNKKLYIGWWEDLKVLNKMPADFAAFLYRLKNLDGKGEIFIQPMEDAEKIEQYDNQTMLEWLKETPSYIKNLADSGDPIAKKLYDNLTAPDKKGDQKDQWAQMFDSLKARLGMKNVNGELQLYGRSAGGEHPSVLNAAMFLNFYISEVGMRYTGPEGSGSVAKVLLKAMEKYKKEINVRTEATVASIEPMPDGSSQVYYRKKNGEIFKVRSKNVVYASQLGFSPTVIKTFDKNAAPEKFEALDKLEYRHYIVINLHLQGHPHVPKTYDLWVRNDKGYDQMKITDIIDGRWMHFEGKPSSERTDNRGVATIYVPLPKNLTLEHMSEKQILRLSQSAINQGLRFINESNGAQGVGPVVAQINVWPNSIHIASTGHFKRMKAFNEPFKNIFFAHSNMGTPSIEEAMVRGFFAALKIHSERTGIPYETLIEEAKKEIESIPDKEKTDHGAGHDDMSPRVAN